VRTANAPGTGKRGRQRAIRELVARQSVGSQEELVDHLAGRGFPTTQATVSRDVTELGLVKVARGDRHVYVSPEDLATPTAASDVHLRRIVADIPVTIGRSGLILVLVSSPGTAPVLAQAIDDSTLQEQEGTLAGDNTLLVLFRDEERLGRWRERFLAIQAAGAEGRTRVSSPDPTPISFTEAPR